MRKYRFDGFVIALAWPETKCKQAGAWYDGLMKLAKINRENHYKVGHAAVILVNAETGKCHYFDFGRYHAPAGYGRVRDAITDHDLEIQNSAEIDQDGNINNLEIILKELNENPSTHGEGPVHASFVHVDFRKAYKKAKKMQDHSPIKYGPFQWRGTNCSRFVRTIVLSGNPEFNIKLRISFPLTITPTPMFNVNALKNIYVGVKSDIPHVLKSINYPIKRKSA